MSLSKQVAISGITRFSLIVGFVITLGLAAGWSRPKVAEDEIMAAFGLKSGELTTIDQVSKSEMAITMNGQDYMIDYALFSNRSKRFRLLVQTESGMAEQVAPTVSTIRGTLRGVEGSRVIGCVTEDGCCARIKFPSGEDCFVEPVNRTLDNPAMAGVHVVYSQDDVITKEMQCGTVTNLVQAQQQVEQNLVAPVASAVSGNDLYVCELSIDTDFEYFSIFGSTETTLSILELVVNIINDQYESDAAIRHVITEAIVRTTANDPYTADTAGGLLTEFRNYHNAAGPGHGIFTGDLAHMITGRTLSTSVVGVAQVGAVCNPGYAVSMRFSRLSLQTDVIAHELGHNWNQRHCDCPGHTMNASLTGANDFNDAITVPNLIAYRDTRTCLDVISPNGSGASGIANNDDWVNRIAISGLNFSETGANFNATTERFEQDLVNVASSVWWSVEADLDGTITINTFGSDFDTELHVYELAPGDSFGDLILISENDDTNGSQSQVTFDVTEGTHYQIRVGGFRPTGTFGASEGNIVLNGVLASPILLGDVNLDGMVNFFDIPMFIDVVLTNVFQAEADINEDGLVDFDDIAPFIDLVLGS